jgi:hypothetical protein
MQDPFGNVCAPGQTLDALEVRWERMIVSVITATTSFPVPEGGPLLYDARSHRISHVGASASLGLLNPAAPAD